MSKRPERPERPMPDGGALPDGSHFGEALVALFAFGLVAFSPLVLDVFDPPPELLGAGGGGTVMVLGIPLLFLFLFLAWGVLIGLLGLVVERAARAPAPARTPPSRSEVE